MIEEIWKDISGYPNYQVSNLGRVKSLGNDKNRKEKILKSSKEGWGYLQVLLSKDGKSKYFKVHRLVASAFLDNSNNLPEVNHKDEDKTNNRVENLEYCDRTYNNNYGSRNERTAIANSKPVLQFTKQGEFIKKWKSTREVERELGFNHSNIAQCCQGKLKSSNGYEWKYLEEKEKVA